MKSTMRSKWKSAVVLAFLLAAVVIFGHYLVAATPPQQDWEPSIRAFEEQDKTSPPKPGAIVFTGSSTVARWDSLSSDMKGLNVINRGFGGSQWSDLNHYVDRVVIAYHPPAVVVYEGDNDLSAESSKTPEAVAKDAEQFITTVRAALPDTRIYILSIKPSKARWQRWPLMKRANAMIRDYIRAQQRVEYIDITPLMFDKSGKLRDDLFVEDGLHVNAKGYALWASVIRPALEKRAAAAR
jgi:lysophospholipase L1-like esterase